MRDLARLLLALLVSLLLTDPVLAAGLEQVPDCAGLSDRDRARVEPLMEQHHLYADCEGSIATCLAASPPSPLARRLTGELCRRVEAGESDAEIDAALKKRAQSMAPDGPTVDLDLEGVPSYGEADAPVQAVIYACPRCPFCASTTLALLHALQPGGVLHGKVRLYFKLFPLKGHVGSVEASLAALAAQDQGQFWPFITEVYEEFDHFSVSRLPSWAQEVGLDMTAYQATVTDPATRDVLVAWKREGLANGVHATPTLFIDGRLYLGSMHNEQLLDVLLEEYERRSAE